MRFSSPEPSDSSAPPITHRIKPRRRRIPPSHDPSTTQPRRHYEQQDDNEDEYSTSISQQEEELAADEDETADADADADAEDSPLDSYSDVQSQTSAANSSTVAAVPPPPYVNVAPLPIFRGTADECPIAHLSRFERVCRANNATTIEMVSRIFPVTLDGEAALWYEITIERARSSMAWEDVKSAFLRAYRRPGFVERARVELMALRQGENEGVNAYHLRMQWILRGWPDHGIPDALLMGIFVDGLKEDFQDWVVPRRPGTLEEAVRMALGWEQARSARAVRRKGEVKCGFCDGLHEEGGCEVRRRMRELWLRSKERGGADGRDEAGTSLAAMETGGSMARRREASGEEGEGVRRVLSLMSSRRRSQCSCWKHQCWKKLERSNSVVLTTDENPFTPTE